MGDRTHVELTILSKQCDLFEASQLDTGWYEKTIYEEHACYAYDEVNYGDLTYGDDQFYERITNQGIAFDVDWKSGSDYGSGCISARFNNLGILIKVQIYENSINLNINKLLSVIKSDYRTVFQKYLEMRKIILKHEKTILVIPWTDQIEWGRIHRTKLLIGADSP